MRLKLAGLVSLVLLQPHGVSHPVASPGEPIAIPVDDPELREIAAVGGAVWVVGTDVVVRVDPTTSVVTDTIGVTGARGIAAVDSAVWVGSTYGAIVRIDPLSRQIVSELTTGRVAVEGVTADDYSAWLVADGIVFAIDPATNTVVREIQVIGDFPEVAVGVTAVWVSPGTNGPPQLQRVDRVSGEVTSVDVGERLSSVASDGTVAWVVSDDRDVCRVDDVTADVACADTGIDEFDQEIASIAYGDGGLWAVVRGDAVSGEGYRMIGLDPVTLEVLVDIAVPVGDLSVFDIAAGDGAVYISNDVGPSSSVIVIPTS